MRQTFWVFISFCFGLSTTATLSYADQTKATLSGFVRDEGGGVVRGAQVSISGSEIRDIEQNSNENGAYTVNGLAPGTYTVTTTYVGFEPEKQIVEIQPHANAQLTTTLHLSSQKTTVNVTAGRLSGEAEAVNVERSADNLLQVLPNEVIRSLPNANLADALGRMPSVTLERDEGEGKYVQIRGTEPRLTNTTVDGINLPSQEPGVRQIKFDGIPSDIVQEVQISKTLQANMDGDGIGGSVNLVTKTAGDLPSISLSGIGGYTPIVNGRGLTEETFTASDRFLRDKRLGVLIGGSYDWNGRGIDDVEPVPDIATLPNGKQVPWKDGADIREYEYFRSRWGLAGSVDYRIADGQSVYVRALYSDFKNYGDRWVYSLVDNTPGIQVLNSSNVGSTPSFNTQIRKPDIKVGSIVLGGSHVFATTWYHWEASVGRSGYYGGSSTAKFGYIPTSSNCQYDPAATTDIYIPRFTPACFSEAYNPRAFTLNEVDEDMGHAGQLNLSVAGSGAKRYQIGSRSAVFEYGGKFRNDNKYSGQYQLTVNPDGSIPLNAFPDRLVNRHYYLGGEYQLGYNPDATDVLTYIANHPNAFAYASTQGGDPSDFTIIEKVSAGYLMNTVDISSRMRLIVGLRAEVTTDAVRNLAFPGVVLNQFSGSYYNLLPSASLKYRVGPNDYVRLVYARGLSRPDPQDIAQPLSWSVNGNGADRYSVSFGNANLEAETGDDIDVLFEHYITPFGMVSAGYFYKSLSDPIVTTSRQLVNYQPPGGPLGNYLATQPVNAGSAWISGFEFNYLQHYSSLPGLLNGLGMSANYGYTASRASGIAGRSDHPALLRTSPNAFNLSPTYDKGRFSIRVGLSYNQASIYQYQYTDGTAGGVNGPLSDIYFYSHFQVDAQGSIGLGHGLQFVAYGLNLNNEVFGFYQGSPQYMIQREYYQPTVAAGFRLSLNRER